MFGPKAMIILVLVAMIVGFGYIALTSQRTAEAQGQMRSAGEPSERERMVNQAMEETERIYGN